MWPAALAFDSASLWTPGTQLRRIERMFYVNMRERRCPVTSWREDKRFQCPLCGSRIELKFLYRPESSPAFKNGILAICLTCDCVYSMENWKTAWRDPEEARRRFRESNARLRRRMKEHPQHREDDRGPDGLYDVPF